MSGASMTQRWRLAVAAVAVAGIASLGLAATHGSHEWKQEGAGCVYYNPVDGTYGNQPGPGNPIYYNPVTGTYSNSCV
jgi:hypothetical protein